MYLEPHEHFELTPDMLPLPHELEDFPPEVITDFVPDYFPDLIQSEVPPEELKKQQRAGWIARHLPYIKHGLTSLVEQAGSWRYDKVHWAVGYVVAKKVFNEGSNEARAAINQFRILSVTPVEKAGEVAYHIHEMYLDAKTRRLKRAAGDAEVVQLPKRLGEGHSRPEDFEVVIGQPIKVKGTAWESFGEVVHILGHYTKDEIAYRRARRRLLEDPSQDKSA